MYSRFMVAGLQRTGTNWINQLMKLNFGKSAKPYFWKHLTPLGVVRSYSSIHPNTEVYNPSRLISIPDDLFVIATYKDLELWKRSLERTNKGLYTTHHTHTQDKEVEILESWLEWAETSKNKDNVYLCNYMDWLDNWQQHLENIHRITGWHRTSPRWKNAERVPQSAKFDISNYK